MAAGKELTDGDVAFTPAATAADITLADKTKPVASISELDHSAAGDSPLTPFQAELQHPQRPLYTPSNSESKSVTSVDLSNPYSIAKSVNEQSSPSQDSSRVAQPNIYSVLVDSQDQSLDSGKSVGKDISESQLQLSPAQSHLSSPRFESLDRVDQHSAGQASLHVNSVFDTSNQDEEVSSDSATDAAQSSTSKAGGNVQEERISEQLEGGFAGKKAQVSHAIQR